LQQCRASRHIANFLGWATHVDVDDLRAVRYVMTRGFSEHFRISAGDLYGNRLHFASVIRTTERFLAFPQLRIRRNHFGHRVSRAHAFAQLPERAVRHPGHGGDKQVVAQNVGADGRGGNGHELAEIPNKGTQKRLRKRLF